MKVMKPAPVFPVAKDELDRVFDRFFEPTFWPISQPRIQTMLWEPTLDFSENAKEYVVRLEAPGMARDDFDVDVDGNLLTLSGKRELRLQEKGEDFLWQERQEGKFMRTLRLPTAVMASKIEAVYVDGVLTVRLPKIEPSIKTKVAIK